MRVSKSSNILEEVLAERSSELEFKKKEEEIKKARKIQKESEKKQVLRAQLNTLNKAMKTAQRNLSELAKDQKVRNFILESLQQNCKQETIGGQNTFKLIALNGLILNDAYPNDGFNDVYLFLDKNLALCVAYLRYMTHEYGYSSRSDEKLFLDASYDSPEESEALEHIKYDLNRIWRDKLIPGVLRALSDKKSALEFFIKVLPNQKEWWEMEEHQSPLFSDEQSRLAWHGQPLLKIC